jgi:hypothetical protein
MKMQRDASIIDLLREPSAVRPDACSDGQKADG